MIVTTLDEIEERFGPLSLESQEIHGVWQHEGKTYRDKQVRVFIDVPDLPENRQFFAGFKECLKDRFQQIDIWITTHTLEIV